jgi:hypothetical protein
LVRVFEKQTRCTEATELYKEAYEGASKTLGETHENTEDYNRDYDQLRARLQVSLSDVTTTDATKKTEKSVVVKKQNERAATVNAIFTSGSKDGCVGSIEPSSLAPPVTYGKKVMSSRVAITAL